MDYRWLQDTITNRENIIYFLPRCLESNPGGPCPFPRLSRSTVTSLMGQDGSGWQWRLGSAVTQQCGLKYRIVYLSLPTAPILPPTSVVSVWRQFTLKYQEKSFCKLYEIKASRWWHWWWRCTVSGHVQEQVRCLCVHLQLLSFQSVTLLLYRIRDCGHLSMEVPVKTGSKTDT